MQQPLTLWAVSGAGAKRLREEPLARAGAAQAKALAIGLPWPKPAKRGKAFCQEAHWHDVLYASIIAGDELPDDVGLEPPAWWKRGDGLSPPEHRQQRQVKLLTMSMRIKNQDTSRYHR